MWHERVMCPYPGMSWYCVAHSTKMFMLRTRFTPYGDSLELQFTSSGMKVACVRCQHAHLVVFAVLSCGRFFGSFSSVCAARSISILSEHFGVIGEFRTHAVHRANGQWMMAEAIC